MGKDLGLILPSKKKEKEKEREKGHLDSTSEKLEEGMASSPRKRVCGRSQ